MDELRVLIVDDEILAIEHLKDLIPWDEYGYKIVAEATDAKNALELFKKHRPQIVISDICMSGMDGLEFCSNILSVEGTTKIILLSAYKEFEYAKKAIELGVFGYLVKHEVDSGSLLKELDKVRKELEKEESANRIIKKHTIKDFFENDIDSSTYQNPVWNLLETKNSRFILILLAVDTPYPVFDRKSKLTQIDLDYVHKTLYRQLPDGFSFIEHFKLRNQTWAMLFSCSSYLGEGYLWNEFYPVALKTQELVSGLTGCSFTIVVSLPEQKIEKITKLYHESLKVLEYIPFLGKGKVLRLQDIPKSANSPRKPEETGPIVQKISHNLYALDFDKVKNNIEELFTKILIPSWDPDLLKACCDELIRILDRWCKDNFLPSPKSDTSEVRGLIEGCYTAYELKEMFIRLFESNIAKVLDANFHNYSQKVQKAIEYLHSNYSRDISVVGVANILEVSDSHLSRIFKIETGKTLLEYLTEIRIEAAKTLLDDYNYKIYEISELVGYKTSQYFSQVFVKLTGMNPLNYRERKKKHG